MKNSRCLPFVLWCLLGFVNLYADYKSIISEMNFTVVGDYSYQYQPSYNVSFLDANAHYFNHIVYRLHDKYNQNSSLLFSLDVDKQVLHAKGQVADVEESLLALVDKKPLYGLAPAFYNSVTGHLENQYSITVNAFYERRKCEALHSKRNTAEAMKLLADNYKDDRVMSFYIKKFFPDTGVVESVDLLELVGQHQQTGIVFKFDEGECGECVSIIDPDKVKNLTDNQSIKKYIASTTRVFETVEDIDNAIKSNKLIWQELLASKDGNKLELGAPFYHVEDNQYKLGKTCQYTVFNQYKVASEFTRQGHRHFFTEISSDALEYFERIVNELMVAKVFLMFGEPMCRHLASLFTTSGVDLIAYDDEEGRQIKISELQVGIQGEIRRASNYFRREQALGGTDTYLVLNTKRMQFNPKVSSDFVYAALETSLDTLLDKTKGICQVDLDEFNLYKHRNEISVYLAFYPVKHEDFEKIMTLFSAFERQLTGLLGAS